MCKSINKMTKKEKKKYYSKQRGNWGDVKPITQIKQSKKLYNRKNNKRIIERSVNKNDTTSRIKTRLKDIKAFSLRNANII